MLNFLFFIKIVCQIDFWNRVFLCGPGAQVNLLASFRAKRPEPIGGNPFNFGATGWAIDGGSHTALLKLRLKITKGQFKWHIAVISFRFEIAALRSEANPEHIFVRRYFGDGRELFINHQAQHLVGFSL